MDLTRRRLLAGISASSIAAAAPTVAKALGAFVWYVTSPSPDNAHPATWALRDPTGAAIDISRSGTCGLQELLNECVASGYPGYGFGGPATGSGAAGVNSSMAFLQQPVDLLPWYSGRLRLDGVSLICAHNGPYVLRTDSLMAMDFQMKGGQIVLSNTASQIGVWFNPRSALPVDTNCPHCAVTSSVWFPSIVGPRGYNQVLCLFDGRSGNCSQIRATFIEPNGGDYGVVAMYGAYGYDGLELDIVGAHQQLYSCVDLGHGSPSPSGTLLRLACAPGPWGNVSQALDCWETNGVYQLLADFEQGAPARLLTFESGSRGCQVTVGGRLAGMAPTVAPGSGPNYVNGLPH